MDLSTMNIGNFYKLTLTNLFTEVSIEVSDSLNDIFRLFVSDNKISFIGCDVNRLFKGWLSVNRINSHYL